MGSGESPSADLAGTIPDAEFLPERSTADCAPIPAAEQPGRVANAPRGEMRLGARPSTVLALTVAAVCLWVFDLTQLALAL